MSEALAELSALLARTAAIGVAPRQCQATSADMALGFVIEAIRTCILPRQLIVSADQKVLLRMEAGGGTLLQILESDAAVSGSHAPGLLERPLRGTDREDVIAAAQLFLTLFPGNQDLFVATKRPDTATDPAQSGIDGDLLLRAVKMVPLSAAITDRFAHFVEAAEEVIVAVIPESGPTRTLHPDITLPRDVADRVAGLFGTTGHPIHDLTEEEMLFLRPTDPDYPAIGVTRTTAGLVALIVEPDSCTDLAAYWADLPHGTVFSED